MSNTSTCAQSESVTLAAGTVVTRNDLARAYLAAESFIAQHPGSTFTVLVADGIPVDAPGSGREDVLLRTPAEIGIDGPEFGWMEIIYQPFELCCALKPQLLRHLLGHAEMAVYLDSDMLVLGPLSGAVDAARQTGVALTPHTLAPLATPAGAPPYELLFLHAGQFNGGFLAVSGGKTAHAFLDAWESKLHRYCIAHDPTAPHLFVDQHWLDAAIGPFPVSILRDPGLNVGHWRLPGAKLIGSDPDGSVVIDGAPLRLFHFSGFDPANPDVVSVYSMDADNPAYRAPSIRALCHRYADMLRERGWRRLTAQPDGTVDGLRLTLPLRRAIRAALIEAERRGVAPAPDPRTPGVLRAWLESSYAGGSISWLQWGLHASQPPSARESPAPHSAAVADPPVSGAIAATPGPRAKSGPRSTAVSPALRQFTDALPFERESILQFALAAAADIPAGSRMLDLGAGNSPYRELFAHARYESHDWQHSVHPGARTVDHVGPADAIPVPDAEFDAVLCTQVLEHVPDPRAVLREMRRILRTGGRLYMTVPLAWELHEMPFDFFRYTASGLHGLLTDAGFIDVDIRPRNDALQTIAQLMQNLPEMVGRYPDGHDPERQRAAVLLRNIATQIASLSTLDSRRIFPLGFSVTATVPRGDEEPRHVDVAGRAAAGMAGARRFVTLCFGADVLNAQHLLVEYARHFTDADDATLVIYLANTNIDEAVAALQQLVANTGTDGPRGPHMIGLPLTGSADEQAMSASVDAVLATQPPRGAFTGLPWAHPGTLAEIRTVMAATV